MIFVIQPKRGQWTGQKLALTLCDMLYGRAMTPTPHPEKEGSWDINGMNNILVHPMGSEPTEWKISCRYGLSEAVVAFLEERIGPIDNSL